MNLAVYAIQVRLTVRSTMVGRASRQESCLPHSSPAVSCALAAWRCSVSLFEATSLAHSSAPSHPAAYLLRPRCGCFARWRRAGRARSWGGSSAAASSPLCRRPRPLPSCCTAAASGSCCGASPSRAAGGESPLLLVQMPLLLWAMCHTCVSVAWWDRSARWCRLRPVHAAPAPCVNDTSLLHLPPLTRRRKKLREVGLVTTICATCFLFRCGAAGAGCGGRCFSRMCSGFTPGWGSSWTSTPSAFIPPHPAPATTVNPTSPSAPVPPCCRSVIVAWSTFDYEDADLDVMGHPLLNIIYYRCVVGVPLFLAYWVSGATDCT